MQLNAESEWMKSQKHAEVMSPDGHFEVVQTDNECTLYFSLGTDSVFYVTREIQASSTGWTKTALSDSISGLLGGAQVQAKSFSISQNAATGKYDLALAVTTGGSDRLFVSLGNSNADEANWADGVDWTQLPYDAYDDPNELTRKLKIADVYIMNVPTIGSTIVVDIEEAPGNTTLDRFFVTPGKPRVWNKHLLPIDLNAGSIQSVLGRRDKDRVPGIYTFGRLEGKTQLIYAPIFNFFKPKVAPSPARLAIPDGTMSIASAVNSAGFSNLFVSHANGVSVYPHNLQNDDSAPSPCATGPLVSGATQLSALTMGKITSVWGRNSQGELFYMECPAGSEANTSSWTPPVTLLPSVEQFAFYTGRHSTSHTLYAHVEGQDMVELAQDPVTTDWRQRQIILPSTDLNSVKEFNSYVTRVEVLDDNEIAQPNVKVNLTSISPVPVFVNNVYYVLSPRNAVHVLTDVHGSINIIQPTESMAAVCYGVALDSPGAATLSINPANKVMLKLNAIQSGGDLANVLIEKPDGGVKTLLPDGVNTSDADSAAAALKQLCDIHKGLNQDGTPSSKTAQVDNSPDGVRVLSVNSTGSGRLATETTTAAARDGNSLLVKVGDFFRMLKQKFTDFVVKVVDGVYHVFTTIGNAIYRAVLDCVSAVAHAVEWIMEKIKVVFDDIVSWLGFVFSWKDIVRTHNVLKNVIKQYVVKSLNEIDVIREKVVDTFNELESKVNAWADITDPGETNGAFSKGRIRLDPGSNTPQAQWALNHVKNNVQNADMSITEVAFAGIEQLLQDLVTLATAEEQTIRDMIKQIQDQIVKPWDTLTPIQVAKKLLAITSDLILKTGRNIAATLLDVLKHVATTVVQMLDAPIRIPILSKLYKDISGNELSILDVVCLVLAVPSTVLYKAVAGKAPFPENSGTSALTEATSWHGLQEVMDSYGGSNGQPDHTVRAMARVAKFSDAPPSHGHAGEIRAMAVESWSPYRVLRVIGRFCNMAAAWMACVFNPFNMLKKNDKEKPSWLTAMSALTTIVGQIQPIIDAFQRPTEWQMILQDIIVGIIVVKAVGDVVLSSSDHYKTAKPVLDGVVQLTLVAPHIGGIVAHHSNESDYVQLGAQLSARIGGLCQIAATSPNVPKPEDIIASAANVAMMFISGVLLLTNGVMIIEGK